MAGAPLQMRVEARTELAGDMTVSCTGGTPGTPLQTNATLTLNRNITNLSANNQITQTLLFIDSGGGFQPSAAIASLTGPNSVTFGGINATLSATGQAVLKITGIRVDVATSADPVTAFLSFNGASSLSLNTNMATVGRPLAGLLTSGAPGQVNCILSVFPDAMTMQAAAEKGTVVFTARATEGFETAFLRKQAGELTGTRLLLRYQGFPRGTRLAVPDLIAGSSAQSQTSPGALGVPASRGAYAPSAAGSLLLVRVLGTDAFGAGGYPVLPAGAAPAFGTLRDVELSQTGSGIAVYEVLDSSNLLRESAQFPTYLELTELPANTPAVGSYKITLGPIAPAGAVVTSIPSFADVTPSNDCTTLGDCNSSYFPRLFVDRTEITASAAIGSGYQVEYIRIRNESGAALNWSARVDYTNGADWLRLDRTSGPNNSTIRADLLPEKIAQPGVYRASIIIDAGPVAGSRIVPVTFTVTGANPLLPLIESVSHAASFQERLVPGGLAMLKGLRLNGNDVRVTAGGTQARTVYAGEQQINFEAPSTLAAGASGSAEVVVTVNGRSSIAKVVPVSPVLPGVFAGGILNADGVANSTSRPATIGQTIRLYVTGVPRTAFSSVNVRIHDWQGLSPVTVDDLPGTPGVQWMDVLVPNGMPAIAADVVVCATAPGESQAQACSMPVKVHLASQ